MWLGLAGIPQPPPKRCASARSLYARSLLVPAITMADKRARCIDSSQLLDLRQRLSTGLPKSNGLRVCIQNVIKGRVDGKFYVDQWPDFTAVVFQCLQPSISSNGDLHCYTTSSSLQSKQQLVVLLEHAGLISTSMWQLLYIVENEDKSIADYVGENLRVGGRHLTREEYAIRKYGIYAMLCPPSKKAELPAGYTLGKLAKEHVKYMLAQDELWIGSVRSNSIIIEYIEQYRQRLETVAVFQCGDTSKPVARAMCFAYTGEYGSLFTRPDHRQKGLASLVVQKISENFSSE